MKIDSKITAPLGKKAILFGTSEEELELIYAIAQNALKNFRKVLRSRHNYPMEFNARMNIIALKLQTGNYSPNHAIAIYERMAKEDKNIEYADQIYAAMAEIALTAGNENQAEGFLKKATSTTSVNPQKKSFNTLKLADLNYTK